MIPWTLIIIGIYLQWSKTTIILIKLIVKIYKITTFLKNILIRFRMKDYLKFETYSLFNVATQFVDIWSEAISLDHPNF